MTPEQRKRADGLTEFFDFLADVKPVALTAHELAHRLLAGPDLPTRISWDSFCCGADGEMRALESGPGVGNVSAEPADGMDGPDGEYAFVVIWPDADGWPEE